MRPLYILKLSDTSHPVKELTSDVVTDVIVLILQDDLNFTCKETDADAEECVASSSPENERCDVKDGDLLLICPLLAENKVSCTV